MKKCTDGSTYGDSGHPLLYLIISSVINVVLDLLFITVFRMGAGSAAAATIISQFISAMLCLRRLVRVKESYQIHMKCIRFDGAKLKQIVRNGIPAGVQSSIIAIANAVVQSNINTFGRDAMAGILRGVDKAIIPMLVMMISWCAVHIMYITINIRYLPEINAIFRAYPLTWALSSVAFLIIYLKEDWENL